ncbi:MAG: cell division protein ZapB [Spirochaetaceae bacterium]|jgi:predicted  nucleic acid-binding Zn-ribbon protein|nr:cell division protein ZapB [Spirochaetaceae bacterium]
MVTVEQVRQLEARVGKAIDYVNKVTDENTLLKNKLDSYQRRIDELEVLIQRFKEDQGRIEEGILSALERLNRFEDDVHKTITPSASQMTETVNEVPSPAPARKNIDNVEDNNFVSSSSGEDETNSDEADSEDEASELDIF